MTVTDDPSQQDRLPAISVVIPTRLGGKELDRAIDSVLAQTEVRFELIIVTDCGAVAIDPVLHHKRTDPRISYHELKNKTGANAARNLGTAMCRSPIITYLDADDELLPDALSNRLTLVNENEEIGFAVSSHLSISGKRSAPKINRRALKPERGLEVPLLASTLHISASAVSVRRDLLDEIGSWNEGLCRLQDRDLLLRLTQVTSCNVSDRIDFRKIETPGSITSSNDNYMKAYSKFLLENQNITNRHRHLIGFRIANRILALLIKGKWSGAFSCYKENRNIQNLDFSWCDLIYTLLTHIFYRKRF
jgi:glycosyltransferase involved in cell wall biosynthesis